MPPFLENSPLPSSCAPFAPNWRIPPWGLLDWLWLEIQMQRERKGGIHTWLAQSGAACHKISALRIKKRKSKKEKKRSTLLYFLGDLIYKFNFVLYYSLCTLQLALSLLALSMDSLRGSIWLKKTVKLFSLLDFFSKISGSLHTAYFKVVKASFSGHQLYNSWSPLKISPEGVCTDDLYSRKPWFLFSAMHSYAHFLCFLPHWFSCSLVVFPCSCILFWRWQFCWVSRFCFSKSFCHWNILLAPPPPPPPNRRQFCYIQYILAGSLRD